MCEMIVWFWRFPKILRTYRNFNKRKSYDVNKEYPTPMQTKLQTAECHRIPSECKKGMASAQLRLVLTVAGTNCIY